MKFSKYQIEQREQLEKRAAQLYQAGLTMREVGLKIGKSRTYVWWAVHKYLPDAFVDNSLDKEKQIDYHNSIEK